MTTTAIESPLRSLRNDRQGAIMVLGIFFACIMIGWMWMLIGLGDAIIWRDRSQEAADAIAYSSSAIQAKGMNIISFLNMIMLVITFIYLIIAIIYNILDFAHVVLGSYDDGGCGNDSLDERADDVKALAAVCDLIPGLDVLGAILTPISNVWVPIGTGVEKAHLLVGKLLAPYEKMMVKVLPVLSSIETVAAYGAPWAGEAVGIYIGSQYVDWGQAREGMPLSATLLPGKLTPFTVKYNADGCETAEDTKSGTCSKYTAQDDRMGLPVEIPDPDGMSKLCFVAGKFITAPFTSLFPGVLGTMLNWLTSGLASGMEGNWCSQKSEGLLGGKCGPGTCAVSDNIASFLPPFAGFQEWTSDQFAGNSNNETCPNNNWGQNSGGGGAGNYGCGGPGTCNGVYDIQDGSGKHLWENPEEMGGPHLVVEYATNGSDWMQSWSFAYGGNRQEQSEKKVGVAGMDSQGPTGGKTGTWQSVIPQNSESLLGGFTMYVGQSEFYFDCNNTWNDANCNADYNRASFQMSWRARLRRVRMLSWKQDLWNYFSGGTLGNQVNNAFKSWVTTNAGDPSSMSGKFGNFLSNSILSGAFGSLKSQTFEKIGGMLNPDTTLALPDIIH